MGPPWRVLGGLGPSLTVEMGEYLVNERLPSGRISQPRSDLGSRSSSNTACKETPFMSFFETHYRRLCLFRAVGVFVFAAAMISLPLTTHGDRFGLNFAFAVAGICILVGLYNLRLARRESAQKVKLVVSPYWYSPDPKTRLRRISRRYFWIGLVCFPVAEASFVYDLYQLETGAVKQVQIHEPIASIYTHFGFWPAVLALPVIWIPLLIVFWIFREKKTVATEQSI